VRLFVEVCGAVQHAHQKGMIHRDLKPSNVLVSEVDGRALPRVIDFGIAKAVESDEFDGARLTRDDQIIGTPAYMSPEQIEGSKDIDTRSDIYSLGVLLYELLAGALPYGPGAYRGWASLAASLLQEPPLPSRRLADLEPEVETIAKQRATTRSGLLNDLRGDLDFIVSRAMEKDRSSRYETANALALDLQRFLSFQPVRAVGPGSFYVARKFVRRHRLSVAFAAAAAVGLVGFSLVTALQANRISRARDQADARRQQAEGLIDFMLTDLRDKLEPLGRLDVLEDVGSAATRYFASLPESELTEEELLSRSQALYQIGENKVNAGELASAETAFTESLRLAAELSRRAPENTERLFALGQSYFWAGYVPYLEGDFHRALEFFEAYLGVSERLVQLDPENLEFRTELGYAGSNIGSVREASGDLEGAAEAFQSTLSIAQGLAQAEPENLERRWDVAHDLNSLAVVLRKRGRLEEARSRHEAELQIKEELVSLEPENVPWRRLLALGHQYLGEVETLLGNEEGALENFEEAVSLHIGLMAVDPSNAEWQRGLAINRRLLGLALARFGEAAPAREELQASQRLLLDLVSRDEESLDWQRELTACQTALSRIHAMSGDPNLALELVELGLSGLAPFLLRGAPDLETRLEEADALLTRGRILADLGRREEANLSWESALEAVRAVGDQQPLVEFRDLEVRILTLLGRNAEAERGLEGLRSIGYRHPDLTELVGD
jgi:serine/threonine-protein kinase